MVKKYILLLSLLFFIEGIFALSIDMKDIYDKKETLIAELKGDIKGGVLKENVELWRGHVQVPMEFDLKKINGKYYLWAIVPEKENNYTLIIKNIETTEEGIPVKKNLEKDFFVTSNLTSFNVKPGLIKASKDFEISIYLFEDEEREINFKTQKESSLILKPGENKIKFSIEDFKENMTMLQIGDYKIPVFIIQKKQDVINKEIKLKLNPLSIISTIRKDSLIEYPFLIINSGKDDLEDIKIDYNKDLFKINIEDKFDLKAQEFLVLNLSIVGEITPEIEEKGINDKIILIKDNQTFELPVIIKFTKNISEVETPYLEKELFYCNELNGEMCLAGFECEGEIKASIEGNCCIGKCVEQKKEKGYSWVGWLLGGLTLFILLIVFLKYKKTKKQKNSFEKKIKEAEKKVHPR